MEKAVLKPHLFPWSKPHLARARLSIWMSVKITLDCSYTGHTETAPENGVCVGGCPHRATESLGAVDRN